jgi:uncharacterized protein YbjQ (UPF0145 family)
MQTGIGPSCARGVGTLSSGLHKSSTHQRRSRRCGHDRSYDSIENQGTAEGETYGELLKSAEALGANAILNACYDDALDVDTLFHGAAVVIEPIPASLQHLVTNVPVFESAQAVERTKEVI